MSVLTDTIGRYIPIVNRKPKIGRKEALAIIPVRNSLIEWERKESEVFLTIPIRRDGLARIVTRLVRNLPPNRKIVLDDVGGSVWEFCDGRRDIDAVVTAVAGDYKLTRREAEASVTMFLQTLAKKNLIGLMSAGGKNSAKRKK